MALVQFQDNILMATDATERQWTGLIEQVRGIFEAALSEATGLRGNAFGLSSEARDPHTLEVGDAPCQRALCTVRKEWLPTPSSSSHGRPGMVPLRRGGGLPPCLIRPSRHGGVPHKGWSGAVPVSGALCFADRGRVCALGWARKGADVRVEWNILLLTIAGGESGTVVPLLTHVLSAPWCPSHASHSVIPMTVGGCHRTSTATGCALVMGR